MTANAARKAEGDGETDRATFLADRRAFERREIRSTPDGLRPLVFTPPPVKAAIRFCLKLGGLWRRGLANGLDIRLKTVQLELPRLPQAFDGYRILHITDPHFNAAEGLADAIVQRVQGADADLCVLTGDFRHAHVGPFTELDVLEPLKEIRAAVRAPDGFLLTLGNHDCADMVEPFEALGYEVLINETRLLRRGNQAVSVTGLDDVHRFYTPAAKQALTRQEPETFSIVLAHSAEIAGEAAAAGHDLYLCGHTHGGQLCLPGGRAVVTHLGRHKELYSGLWQLGGMTGYSSNGAGLSGVPVRFNCPAEVTMFVLSSKGHDG